MALLDYVEKHNSLVASGSPTRQEAGVVVQVDVGTRPGQDAWNQTRGASSKYDGVLHVFAITFWIHVQST